MLVDNENILENSIYILRNAISSIIDMISKILNYRNIILDSLKKIKLVDHKIHIGISTKLKSEITKTIDSCTRSIYVNVIEVYDM